MYYYSMFGLTVESEFCFHEAISVEYKDVSKVDVRIVEADLDERLQTETEEEIKRGYGSVYRYGKHSAWIRVVNHGAFLISNGNLIQYKLKDTYNELEVSEWLLCACIPLILVQKKIIAVHGSGVAIDNKAFVISGESGSGKSTFTQLLLQKGALFMADDTVALGCPEDKVVAYPAYPQQKFCEDALDEYGIDKNDLIQLLPDEDGTKYARRLKSGYCKEPVELYAIVVIKKGEVNEPVLREITGGLKLQYLINNLYKRTAYDYMGFDDELSDKCIKYMNMVKVIEITRPGKGMSVNEQYKLLRDFMDGSNI